MHVVQKDLQKLAAEAPLTWGLGFRVFFLGSRVRETFDVRSPLT